MIETPTHATTAHTLACSRERSRRAAEVGGPNHEPASLAARRTRSGADPLAHPSEGVTFPEHPHRSADISASLTFRWIGPTTRRSR
jgi:hypothetical protein